ncbi:hypothetical protein BDR26DRAFT_859869 [Obelidium mucronatum]|nr:hypothetical protein BDR26DRAFT_859869 [Obelidium mucronatum]
MMCNGTALMRRRSDSFLNVTQILKVANVDKNKRMQVLEAISENAKSEKIQGGYGKYQGVWVPMARAVKIAERFHAAAILQPLVDFQPPQAGSQQENVAKVGKPIVSGDSRSSKPAGQQKPATTSHKRKELERPKRGGRSAQQAESSSGSDFDDDDDDGEDPASVAPNRPTGRGKRIRGVIGESDDEVMAEFDATGANNVSQITKLTPARLSIERQRQILLSIFTGPDRASPPEFLVSKQPGDQEIEPDLVIDDVGHTALHWAATLGKLPIAAALISSKTCSPFAINSNGESALIRAVLSSNNSDSQSFKSLIKLFGAKVLILRDNKQRSVLHHISLGFGVRGYSGAARYYLECVLEFIAKNSAEEPELKSLLDGQDVNGDTALNIAARIGGRVAVELFVEAGASYEIPNSAGLTPVDFGMDDLWKAKLSTSTESVVPTKAISSGLPPHPAGSIGAESDALLKKAFDLSQGLQNMIQTLNSSFSEQVQAKETQLTSKRKLIQTLAAELSDLNRVNQVLRTQNARLPDLASKLQAVELSLKEDLERKAEAARRAMENELDSVVAIDSADGDTAMKEGGGAPEVENISTSDESGASYLRTDNQILAAEIEAIKASDQAHELNYKRIIGMCCNLEVEQIDAAMLGVLLAAVESDDNGTGSIAGTSLALANGSNVAAGTESAKVDDPLASLLEDEQKDGALDGLLFKATSLASL